MWGVQGQTEALVFLRKVVEGRISSPLLLVGREGVGKKFSAIQAAKEALSGGDRESRHIKAIDRGDHPDYTLIESLDKDLGISVVRDVLDRSNDRPMYASRRFIILDGADRMTSAASNALLKVLEEPPETTQFILIAARELEVLPTIQSRCVRVRYNCLEESYITEVLGGSTVARVCARLADGSLGVASAFVRANRLQLRDRLVSLLEVCPTKDLSRIFALVDDVEADLELSILFLSRILLDLRLLETPELVANIDILDRLASVLRRVGVERSHSLAQRLLEIPEGKINLSFHLKAALAAVFE